jgi:hypothetical protein
MKGYSSLWHNDSEAQKAAGTCFWTLVTGTPNQPRGKVDSGNATSANAEADKAYRELTVPGALVKKILG